MNKTIGLSQLKTMLKTACILLFPGLLQLTATAQDTAANIDSLITKKHRSGKFNGTVLVAERGQVIFRKAIGMADDSRPLEIQTRFYLGSLAKAFTGMAVMMLAEEGKLSYDEKVNTYLPDLPDITNDITIRNLLNHTSGLPDYYAMGKYVDGMTNEMVLEVAVNLDSLEFPPGSRYAYSNTGYVLLSLVIEQVSGQKFRQFVKHRVFEPLGMANSEVIDGTHPELSLKAVGHTQYGEINDYQAFTTGAGGIYSQVDDLYLWDQALDKNTLVKKRTLKRAFSPAKLKNGAPSYYGFGWVLDKDNPQIVEHSGSLVGFRTYLYRDIENKITVILLSNFTNDVGAIKEEIVKIFKENR